MNLSDDSGNDAKIVFFVLYNAALVILLYFGVDMYLDDDDVEQRTGLILLAISAVLLAINFLWLVCGRNLQLLQAFCSILVDICANC